VLALEIVLAVPLVLVLLVVAVTARRRWLQSAGGTVELALRLGRRDRGGGWASGVGFFDGDDLRWYRLLSLSPLPRRVLSRRELQVVSRRPASEPERLSLPDGAVVLTCSAGGRPVDLALQASTVTGFLAWLESRPPGATLPV
jgi:hypothetical protein